MVASNRIKVFTDYDDTLVAAGCEGIAGIDDRLPKHTAYPGISTLIEELSETKRVRCSCFFGDNGQGDLHAAESICEFVQEYNRNQPKRKQEFYGFIHDVVPSKKRRPGMYAHHPTTLSGGESNDKVRIVLYTDARGAASAAHSFGLIDGVAKEVVCRQFDRQQRAIKRQLESDATATSSTNEEASVHILTSRPEQLRLLKDVRHMKQQANLPQHLDVSVEWGTLKSGMQWAFDSQRYQNHTIKKRLGDHKMKTWRKIQIRNK